MSTQRLGIIMHGVTGRMGLNQHLIRSIKAIREQGGVRLSNGDTVMPDPILIGRGADQMQALAAAHGGLRWGTDLSKALANRDDTVFFDAATTQMRPSLVQQAIAAGKHVYCEKPSATNLKEALGIWRAAERAGRQARRGAGQAVAAGAAEAEDAAATRASSGASCRCAASSATGCSKATCSRPAAVVELPQGGRRRHHPRHAVPLALRDRQPVRRGPQRVVPGRHAHPAPLGRAGPAVRRDRRRRGLRDLRAGRRSRCALQRSWCVRVRRDDLLTLQVDGTHGSAVAGLRECWVQPRVVDAQPVWNPDLPQPIDFLAGWQEVPETVASTTMRSRRSGSCSCGTSSKDGRSAGTCAKGPRACSWPKRG